MSITDYDIVMFTFLMTLQLSSVLKNKLKQMFRELKMQKYKVALLLISLLVWTRPLTDASPHIISPTQVTVSNEVTTVIKLMLGGGMNVTVVSFSIAQGTDPNLANTLPSFLSLNGTDFVVSVNATSTGPTGVRIVFTLRDGVDNTNGISVVLLIIIGPNQPPNLESSYSFSVSEGAANGTSIGLIIFTDEESNTVTFKSSIPTIFSFKPNSNELVVVNSDALDRETKPTYTFTVNVTDSEGLWSTATVIVTLSDINDVVPVITNSLSDLMRTIIQSTPIGHSLVNLTAVDADEGTNQEVSFSLEDPLLPFQISHQELTVNSTLEAKIYKVVVVVTDHGTPPLSSNTTVTVQVEPNNEYFPEFQSTPYEFEFLENSNGSIFTFNITDGDIGGLGTPGMANITLLPSMYSSSFELSMDRTSWGTVGRLTVLSPFDREILTTFNLTVQAYDTGYVEFRKTSETAIIVIIGDVNDNFPQFTNDTYTANVAENTTNGHLFFQVAANDQDSDLDSSLTFSLLNHKDTFSINPSTGWIYVVGTLNRASFPNYTLELQVNDTANHTDSAYVFVTVTKVNEDNFDPLPSSVVTTYGLSSPTTTETFMTSPASSSLSTGPISSTNMLLSDLLEPLSSRTSKTELISSTSSFHSSTLSTYTSITDASITLVASSSAFTTSSQVIESISTIMTTSTLPTPFPKAVCPETITVIPSHSGRQDLEIILLWPETNVREEVVVKCPCGNGSFGGEILKASRYCGGDAKWAQANVAACNFSDLAREICQLRKLPVAHKVVQLENLTSNSDLLGPTEVTACVSVLLTVTESALGNLMLTTMFLDVVDNILDVSKDILQDSQESSNTSAQVLEAIDLIVANTPITNLSEPVVFSQRSFAVSVQEVKIKDFKQSGHMFSINFKYFSNESQSLSFNDLTFGLTSERPTAAVSLPSNLLNGLSYNTNSTRITHSVFITDSLFLRRYNTFQKVSSVIISAAIVGSGTIKELNPPVNLSFLLNPRINGTSPQCSFWNQSLDDGYGDWSNKGCHNVNITNNKTEVLCECNHLTTFALLLDVSVTIEPTERTELTLFLDAVTYIGIVISLVCLTVTVISYLSIKTLRTSDRGQLLLNLCLALMGLYVTFILAAHSQDIPVLCAVVGAVLQYFFLVTFIVMAAEAIHMYIKLVIVLGRPINHFVLKATILSWVTPFFIVLFCFAPNYKNYLSDHFCRAFNVPYYIGTVAPFLIIYFFNWTIFFIIMFSLIRNIFCSNAISKKDKKESFLYQQLIIAVTLSVLFGLGWGIGLFATQDIHTNKTIQDSLAALFVIMTAFHGLVIFIMHCVRSKEVRNAWKRCFCNVTTKDNSQFTESALSRKCQQKAYIIEPDNFGGPQLYPSAKPINDEANLNKHSSFGDCETHCFYVKKSVTFSVNDAITIENKSVEIAERSL